LCAKPVDYHLTPQRKEEKPFEDAVEVVAYDDTSNASVSEMFPQMDAAKSLRDVLDTRGFLDLA